MKNEKRKSSKMKFITISGPVVFYHVNYSYSQQRRKFERNQ